MKSSIHFRDDLPSLKRLAMVLLKDVTTRVKLSSTAFLFKFLKIQLLRTRHLRKELQEVLKVKRDNNL